MIQIEPLSNRTLSDAIALTDQVFPQQELWNKSSWAFWLSLHPNNILTQTLFWLVGISKVRYWIAVNEMGNLLGVTGLYQNRSDRQEANWLGWTCVVPTARGQGIGGKLVDFAIQTTRSEEKKFLRLYTSTNPCQRVAQALYEKRGFQVIDEKSIKGSRFKKLYRELKL